MVHRERAEVALVDPDQAGPRRKGAVELRLGGRRYDGCGRNGSGRIVLGAPGAFGWAEGSPCRLERYARPGARYECRR